MGGVDHLLPPIPFPRKLFIVEVRDGSAAVAEHFGDLLEEFEMRMHHDPCGGERIVAVLADHDHSIHRQLAGAAGDGFRDGGVKLQGGMPIQPILKYIAFAALIDIERYHIHLGMVIGSAPSITIEKPVHDMLGVQVLSDRQSPRPRAAGVWQMSDFEPCPTFRCRRCSRSRTAGCRGCRQERSRCAPEESVPSCVLYK